MSLNNLINTNFSFFQFDKMIISQISTLLSQFWEKRGWRGLQPTWSAWRTVSFWPWAVLTNHAFYPVCFLLPRYLYVLVLWCRGSSTAWKRQCYSIQGLDGKIPENALPYKKKSWQYYSYYGCNQSLLQGSTQRRNSGAKPPGTDNRLLNYINIIGISIHFVWVS